MLVVCFLVYLYHCVRHVAENTMESFRSLFTDAKFSRTGHNPRLYLYRCNRISPGIRYTMELFRSLYAHLRGGAGSLEEA